MLLLQLHSEHVLGLWWPVPSFLWLVMVAMGIAHAVLASARLVAYVTASVPRELHELAQEEEEELAQQALEDQQTKERHAGTDQSSDAKDEAVAPVSPARQSLDALKESLHTRVNALDVIKAGRSVAPRLLFHSPRGLYVAL